MIGGPTRHMLETREVLDDIKTRFFELDELTFGFTPEQKDKYLMLWVQNLKKMTGQIRKTAGGWYCQGKLQTRYKHGIERLGWLGHEGIQVFRWRGGGAAR